MAFTQRDIDQRQRASRQTKAAERLRLHLARRGLYRGTSIHGLRQTVVRYSPSNFIPQKGIEVRVDGSLRRVP